MRAPLAHSPHSTHGGALVPLDTADREKLLYSNPRLLRSSQLGETCPPPCPCVSMAGILALPMQPDGSPRTSKPRTSLFVLGYVLLVNGERGQESGAASRTDSEDQVEIAFLAIGHLFPIAVGFRKKRVSL